MTATARQLSLFDSRSREADIEYGMSLESWGKETYTGPADPPGIEAYLAVLRAAKEPLRLAWLALPANQARVRRAIEAAT